MECVRANRKKRRARKSKKQVFEEREARKRELEDSHDAQQHVDTAEIVSTQQERRDSHVAFADISLKNRAAENRVASSMTWSTGFPLI